MADPKQSRGYRNNNPGNLEYVPANRWVGQLGIEPPPLDGSAPRFVRFDTPENGIRALELTLQSYQDRHGLRTIRQIITRWAPPKNNRGRQENRTEAYIGFVAERTGFARDERLDVHRYEHARPLVEAIIAYELGGQPYSSAVIDEGLRRAGVVRRGPAAALHADATRAAAGTAAAGVAAATALQPVLDAAAQAAPVLAALKDLSPWVAAAIVLGVAGYFIARQVRRA